MDNHYSSIRYNSKARWLSYWYQINEVILSMPGDVLIIGKGSGIVENVISLIAPWIRLSTVDIDPALLPDVVGDTRRLPFGNNSFDTVLCCQVLEHIPLNDLSDALSEIRRVVKKTVIISVPQKRKYIKVQIDAPIVGERQLIIKYPFNKKGSKSRQHLWEINRGIPYRRFRRLIEDYFVIERTYLNEINCEHRFFVLRKN